MILEDAELRNDWLDELTGMRERMQEMRRLLVTGLGRTTPGRDFSHIGRGKGLFCGAELVADRQTKEPVSEKQVAAVVGECFAQGVIIGASNRSVPGLNNVLCLSPALIATADDIDAITGAIDKALTKVFG